MANRIRDFTSQRFGRLTAIEPTSRRVGHRVVWHCVCDCGEHTLVLGSNLVSGGTQSCGCLSRELSQARQLKHGQSGTKAYAREMRHKRKYGLTPEEHNDLVLFQDGRCAICGILSKELCVDHDHKTGKVRGLLCQQCNAGIGFLKDSPEILCHAAEYVKMGGVR